ncbi:LptA/OstA family protein [Gimesia aquarii]|uniref:OstA-like protein n=1 Tax=Gimesia aquarii TaxID=2527964 RepID=A0A517X3G9_9PLAN|nr:LptA/OstA family protein [Gimesia aquarii]QDU12051.1 OstA-like protein [Gimesia aquarii]
MSGAIHHNRNGLFDRLIASRLLLIWVTTASLTGAYLVYAQAIRLVIKEKVIRREFPKEVIESPAYATGNNERANTYLPESPWAADARYQFQDENVFVYTEKWEQEEEKKAARLKPFAMLMFDTKKGEAEQPFALMSQEALIRFEFPFGVKHTDPGRMIAGSLEGNVKITGPNGLIIYGRNFFYDESSMNIWSDHEVRFAYENHRGHARGIEMKLIPSATKPTELKPAAEGIREIVLRRDVYMELALKKKLESSRNGKPRFATVKSTGSFTFNLETNQGTFTDDVRVYQPTSPHQADTLQCDNLNLQFVRKANDDSPSTIEKESGKSTLSHSSGNLKFQKLVATGNNVTLISEENQFTGTMTRLFYNEDTKTIVLTDKRDVRVLQQSSELRCPEITIVQNQEGKLETVTCQGAGWIKHRDANTGQLTMAAQWAKQMKKSVDPENGLEMVELEKQCIVRQPTEEFALAAQIIRLWLKGDLPSLKKVNSKKQGSNQRESKNSQKIENKLDPYKMIAEQDVAIYSPQLRGKTKRLEVWFGPVATPQSAPNAPIENQTQLQQPTVKQVAFAVEDPILSLKVPQSTRIQTLAMNQSGPFSIQPKKTVSTNNKQTVDSKEGRAKIPSRNKNSDFFGRSDTNKPLEPVMVTADLMTLRVQKNVLGKAEVAEVWTKGNVSVQQLHGEQEKPLHITGNQLHIRNKGSNDQVVHIIGSPAKINERGFQIEGENIFLYRLANRAEVQGKGLLLLPVRGGSRSAAGLLSGAEGITEGKNKAQSPQSHSAAQSDQVLEIHWEKEMIFDGLTANFFGKVRTNMGDNRLRCQEMEVILSDRVSFTEKNSKEQKPKVQLITCRDGVEVESNEYLENRLIGIRRASFWQMNVDQETGNAEANGPGWLILWRRENPGKPDSQTKVSQANQPQKTDTDSWTYTRIDFNGKMEGNVSQRSTNFDDRVQITYGAVKRPLDTINPNKLPPQTGWMRSNSLKLIQHEINGQKKKFISVLAKGNAELEGNTLIKNKRTPMNQSFIARADTISFDESKDLYTMRSFGNRKATLRRYSKGGNGPTMNESQEIEFAPTYDRVTLHGVTVIQGLP